eukprot:3246694-Rhodomonas_salina.2
MRGERARGGVCGRVRRCAAASSRLRRVERSAHAAGLNTARVAAQQSVGSLPTTRAAPCGDLAFAALTRTRTTMPAHCSRHDDLCEDTANSERLGSVDSRLGLGPAASTGEAKATEPRGTRFESKSAGDVRSAKAPHGPLSAPAQTRKRKKDGARRERAEAERRAH